MRAERAQTQLYFHSPISTYAATFATLGLRIIMRDAAFLHFPADAYRISIGDDDFRRCGIGMPLLATAFLRRAARNAARSPGRHGRPRQYFCTRRMPASPPLHLAVFYYYISRHGHIRLMRRDIYGDAFATSPAER